MDDPTRATENYGLHAEKKGVVLSAKPGIFKVHKGLLKETGTVSLEAVFHPKHFLRHKNYKFHLERELNNSMFCEYLRSYTYRNKKRKNSGRVFSSCKIKLKPLKLVSVVLTNF